MPHTQDDEWEEEITAVKGRRAKKRKSIKERTK